VFAQVARSIDQPLLFDALDGGERGGARHRVLLVRVVTQGALRHHVEIRTRDDGRDRQDPAAQPLAEDEDVGHDAPVLRCEHPAGAAEALRDLVEHEERAMPVARRADARPVLRMRDDRNAAHGLGDDGGHVPLALQHVLDVVGAAESAPPGAAEHAMRGVRRRHVLGAGQQGPDVAAEHPLAADARRIERGAVEGVPHRDGFVSTGHDTGQPERHPDGGSAARAEQRLAEITGRDLREFSREVNSPCVRVAPRAERELVELRLDRGDHRGIAEADLMHAVAVEVHVAPALEILEVDAVGSDERVQARRGERLSQEVPRIVIQHALRVTADVISVPRGTRRREIEIALDPLERAPGHLSLAFHPHVPRVLRKQRVPDHVAVIPRDVDGGPDGIQDLQIADPDEPQRPASLR
jgi:hypothetical protein